MKAPACQRADAWRLVAKDIGDSKRKAWYNVFALERVRLGGSRSASTPWKDDLRAGWGSPTQTTRTPASSHIWVLAVTSLARSPDETTSSTRSGKIGFQFGALAAGVM